MEKEFTLSVHDVVDLILRSGDLDSRIFNRSTMQEGTKMHLQYQREQTHPHYQAELTLTGSYTYRDLTFHMVGKADGLYREPHRVVIEEIKTTIADLESFSKTHETWHLMQAAFYGHMYAKTHHLENILIRLIYLNQGTKEKLEKEFSFTFDEITSDVQRVIDEYGAFYQLILEKKEKLYQSLTSLEFPFTSFRSGQRELAKYAYGVAKKGGKLYVEAPTGIGKTMSTLFPVIKTLGNPHEKVFYFTAKNSGKIAAEEALKVIMYEGATLSYCVITAKDSMSFCPKGKINPDDCLYARGYYDKIKDVLVYAFEHYQAFDKQTIQTIAEQFKIEPFELSLDLALFCDVIIADYNYLFDPSAYLRRFFEQVDHPYAVLIDEAHNVVERSRDMYSSFLHQGMITTLKKAITKDYSATFRKTINKLEKLWKTLLVQNTPSVIEVPTSLLTHLEKFLTEAQQEMKTLRTSLPDEAMDVYFKCLRFLNTSELFGPHYHYLLTEEQGVKTLTLFCLDPSKQIKATLDKIKTVICFSATLSPLDYYLPMLGSEEGDAVLKLPSPFPASNFSVMIPASLSTTFKNRGKTVDDIKSYLLSFIDGKVGNYLFFFPSYKYLEDIKALFSRPDCTVISQHKEMTLEDKEAFLAHFTSQPDKTTVGFAVLGGVFSEGIDLLADRLIGVAVISVGLPQLSFHRDLIASYYEKKDHHGFQFAYVYPAINKVLQAMGRVIRSETDRGVALLLDERFLHAEYQDILDKYRQFQVVYSPKDVENRVHTFFKKD